LTKTYGHGIVGKVDGPKDGSCAPRDENERLKEWKNAE